MTSTTRAPLRSLAAVALATTLLLGGCGGGEPPQDASEEEFCDAFNALTEVGDDFDATQDAFADLEEVGTPDDFDADDRAGFELLVDLAREADSEEDAERLADDLGAEEAEQVSGFLFKAATTCTDLPDGLPTDVPSDLLDDLPSDFPTDLLEDLPTG